MKVSSYGGGTRVDGAPRDRRITVLGMKPRATTVLRRFMDGDTIIGIASSCAWPKPLDVQDGVLWIEHCIRRGLRGEVRIPTTRRRSKKR